MNKEQVNNYILEINKFGSLTKAARSLGISQPALSMGLSQLEGELEFSVFDRNTSPIRLTEPGKLYVDLLLKKQALEKEALKKIRDMESGYNGYVKTGAPNVYVNTVLVSAVAEIHRSNPGIRIEIENATVPELLEMTEFSEIDCFISTSEINDRNYKSIFIKDEITYLCVPVSFDLNKCISSDRIDDFHVLDGQDIVFLTRTQPMQIALDKLIKKENISVRHSFIVNQVSTALSLVNNGVAICLASGEAIDEYGKPDRFNRYIMDDELFHRKIYVTYNKSKYLSDACKKLIQQLKGGN